MTVQPCNIIESPALLAAALRRCPPSAAAVPRGLFLISPDAFAPAGESRQDNHYMTVTGPVDTDRALRQHAMLARKLADHVPTITFPGHPDHPEGVFGNNVFAIAHERLILGRMRHAVRAREAERPDIIGFFRAVAGYALVDLRSAGGVCELTGALVIDHARSFAVAGLSERCDINALPQVGMALGLDLILATALAATEYHSNVVASCLAGRAFVIAPEGFADPAVSQALADAGPYATIELDSSEKNAFAGNCLAIDDRHVVMSERAADSLRSATRAALQAARFSIISVPFDAIETAGGSVRCAITEIF